MPQQEGKERVAVGVDPYRWDIIPIFVRYLLHHKILSVIPSVANIPFLKRFGGEVNFCLASQAKRGEGTFP